MKEAKTLTDKERIALNTATSEALGEYLGCEEFEDIVLFEVAGKLIAVIDIKDRIKAVIQDTKEYKDGKLVTPLTQASKRLIGNTVRFDIVVPEVFRQYNGAVYCKTKDDSKGHRWHEIYTIYLRDESTPHILEFIDGEFVPIR